MKPCSKCSTLQSHSNKIEILCIISRLISEIFTQKKKTIKRIKKANPFSLRFCLHFTDKINQFVKFS